MHEPAVAILARRVAASDNNERPSTVSRRNLHILNRGKCIFITGGGIRRRDRVCAFSAWNSALSSSLRVHAHTRIYVHSSLVGRGRRREKREREGNLGEFKRRFNATRRSKNNSNNNNNNNNNSE